MDRFDSFRDSVSAPARSAAPIEPADGQLLPIVPKALFVGSGGDVNLRCIGDNAPVLFRNVASGSLLPIRATEVLATGTTAADLIALS